MALSITPRKREFAFGEAGIPRHWMGDYVLGTHMGNAFHLIFPMGERFFVKSVRRYMEKIEKDPQLLERVRGFCSQEGHHAYAHERFFEVLREQGYDIDGFLELYKRVAWERLEPLMPPKIRLSVTVALEHYTAMFAQRALEQDFLDFAPPMMRDLLRWHAAEEIEHKDVAFDVLMKIDPRYSTRIIGLVLGTAGLMAFWIIGTVMLMRQEKPGALGWLSQLAHGVKKRRIGNGDVIKAFFAYLRPGFHPRDIPNDALAADYLAQLATRS